MGMMEGKVAIVTGAGRGVVLELARAGTAVVAEIEAPGGRAVVCPVSLRRDRPFETGAIRNPYFCTPAIPVRVFVL